MLGLGCENCNIPVLKEYIGEYEEDRVKFLQCQDTEDEIEEALTILGKLYENANKCVREECDAGELIIGMKCGGSDGLSGITANPVVGLSPTFSYQKAAQPFSRKCRRCLVRRRFL